MKVSTVNQQGLGTIQTSAKKPSQTKQLGKKLNLNRYAKENIEKNQGKAAIGNEKEKNNIIQASLKEMEKYKIDFQKSDSEAKQQKDSMKVFINCMKISRRIISGDIVPAKDHKFLKKHDPALYGKSIMMRIPKEDPKKLKAVTKKEDEKIKSSDEKMLEGHNPTSDLLASLDSGDTEASLVDLLV